MNNPKVTIIILNWNKAEDTIECLNSLHELSYNNSSIIVIDNASTDNSVQKIKQKFPDIMLISNKSNLGFCEGNNIGMRYAFQSGAEYIFLLNNDAVIEKSALSYLVKGVEDNPSIGIMGATIMSYREPEKVHVLGGELDFKTGKTFPFPPTMQKSSGGIMEVDWVSGCAFFIKRDVIKKIGYFDPKYFAYKEEVDYCVRAKNNEYKISFCENAKVYHKKDDYVSLIELYFMTRNLPYFILKHAHKKNLLSFFLKHYLYKTIFYKIKKAIVQKKIYDALAISLGFVDFLLMRFGKGSFWLINLVSITNIVRKKRQIKGKSECKKNKTIAYLHRWFPVLSETFILNEMIALRKTGFNIHNYSIGRPVDRIIHKTAEEWSKETIYFDSFLFLNKIVTHFYFLFISPKTYFHFMLKNKNYGGKRVFFDAVCIAKDMKSMGIQHIHINFANLSSYFAMVISKFLKISYSCTLHGSCDVFSHTVPNMERLINNAGACITISKYNKQHILSRWKNIIPEKIKVVYCGVNTEQYVPVEKKKNEISIRILTIGRLVKQKNYPLLLRICKGLRQKGLVFTVHLVGEGPERNNLEKIIDGYDLKENIFLKGAIRQEEIMGEYKKADIFVLTSICEGLPVVLMEAMAVGIPVVASGITGITELVEDGKTGFILPQELEQAVDLIERLITDRELRISVKENARQKVLQQFDIEKNVRKVANLFV